MAWTVCIFLVTIVWIVFGRTLRFDFFNYDDSYYVYQNPSVSDGLTWAGFIRAFTRPLVGNWHPLTSLSLMLDAQCFRLNAGGYHFVNVLLHSIAVVLLFLVLRAMTGARLAECFCGGDLCDSSLARRIGGLDFRTQGCLERCFFHVDARAYYLYARKPPSLAVTCWSQLL